jgi:hypothetical protein
MIVYVIIMFVGTLIRPLILAGALAAAFASRTWWHALLGGLMAGGAQFLVDRLILDYGVHPVFYACAGMFGAWIAFVVREEAGLRSIPERWRSNRLPPSEP